MQVAAILWAGWTQDGNRKPQLQNCESSQSAIEDDFGGLDKSYWTSKGTSCGIWYITGMHPALRALVSSEEVVIIYAALPLYCRFSAVPLILCLRIQWPPTQNKGFFLGGVSVDCSRTGKQVGSVNCWIHARIFFFFFSQFYSPNWKGAASVFWKK